MPPRKPTKNRVNMHDIIGQPLETLPQAVDAILRSPEMLDDIEIKSIFQESSYLLLRAEEAVSCGHEDAFSALIKLFSEGFAHSEESFEEGVKLISLNESLLQTIRSLFVVVVKQEAFPIHSSGTIELTQLISSLCDGSALKDRCGALFMDDLIALLQRIYSNSLDAKKNFHLQRSAMTALINLVKGSKQNKARRSSWKFAVDFCTTTTDVFFLLQCVELLYRVSRQNRSVFSEFADEAFADKLRSLPNDASLLGRMTELIGELTSEKEDIRKYPLTQVSAADTSLTGETDAYFSPFFLVILVTSTNADNITIPYHMIRSVTLGKDGRVILKLEEFPIKLEALLSHTSGMDTISLHMPKEQLNHFKQSSIRTWIIEALQSRKEEQHRRLSGMKRSAEELGKDDRSEKMSVAGSPILSNLSLSAGDKSSEGKQVKRTKLDTTPPGRGRNTSMEPLPQQVAQPMLDVVDDLLESGARTSLLQLKRIIDAKIEYRRGELVASLNSVMGEIQEKVDAARNNTSTVRGRWTRDWSDHVETIENDITETQEITARGVNKLNEGLRSIRSSNQALQERIACLEIEFQQVMEESRQTEQAHVEQLMKVLQGEIERKENLLDQQLLQLQSHRAPAFSDYLQR